MSGDEMLAARSVKDGIPQVSVHIHKSTQSPAALARPRVLDAPHITALRNFIGRTTNALAPFHGGYVALCDRSDHAAFSVPIDAISITLIFAPLAPLTMSPAPTPRRNAMTRSE